MPPSAMTVCALPSSDFVTTPTFAPCADASMAARKPGAAGADDEHVVFDDGMIMDDMHASEQPVKSRPDAHRAHAARRGR